MSIEAHMTRPALPPSYVPEAGGQPHSQRDDGIELPSYEQRDSSPPSFQRQTRKEFSAAMKRNGKPMVELVLTASENLGKTIPTYAEGMPISGKVTLNLDSPQTIHEVILTIKGSILAIENSGDHHNFLNLPTKIWTPATGAISNRNSLSDSTSSSASGSPQSQKLSGKHEWPFSIELPREVVLPHGAKNEIGVFKLPQTFMERHGRVSICYEVLLKVRRSKFKTDFRVNLGFGYIPLIRPSPPSILRQLAYQEGSQIPSPDIDPEGWVTADPVYVQGMVFGRTATVTCKLSLPKPLSYTRGTALPISLSLESPDVQALDLLASPRSIVCRIRRITKYRVGQKAYDVSAWKNAIEDSQLASWWPCGEIDANGRHRRRVSGELHLQRDFKPTSSIATFAIEYSVVLLPFDAIAFQQTESTSTEPLANIPVEIATMYPRGPHPRMYTPPGYESTETRQYDVRGGSAFMM